jgi:BirA family biotin operon repressor/biotin-[acetyl-CoA-carboxylase] ligase
LDIFAETLRRQAMQWYNCLKDGQCDRVSTAYHQALYRRTGFHPYADVQGVFNACIRCVGDDGRLHLLTDRGEARSYRFKEVTFRVPCATG